MEANWRALALPVRRRVLALVFAYSLGVTVVFAIFGVRSPAMLTALFALFLLVYAIAIRRSLHAIQKLDELGISRPDLAAGPWRAANQLVRESFYATWWEEREKRLSWRDWFVDALARWSAMMAIMLVVVAAIAAHELGSDGIQTLRTNVVNFSVSAIAFVVVMMAIAAVDRLYKRRRSPPPQR